MQQSSSTAWASASAATTAATSAFAVSSSSIHNPPHQHAAVWRVSMCSIRDAEQGIYEYLAEKHEPPAQPLDNQEEYENERKRRAFVTGGRLWTPELPLQLPFAVPIRISGWLWRKGGLFRSFKRRFCVFTCANATLTVYASDDTTGATGKVLRHFTVTQVTTSVEPKVHEFRVLGYVEENEIYKKQTASMARRKSSLSLAMPGDHQRFYLPEEETLRAVSDKSHKVWSHCFRNHMKSAARLRRLHKAENGFDDDDDYAKVGEESDESSDDDDDNGNPDFQFHEPERIAKRPGERRGDVFGQRRQGNGDSEDGEDEVSGDVGEYDDDEDLRDQIQFDQEAPMRITATYNALPSTTFFENIKDGYNYVGNGDMAYARAQEREEDNTSRSDQMMLESQQRATTAMMKSSLTSYASTSALTSMRSIWEDDELLSYRVDFDAISKIKRLAVGAFGEVWLATYRVSSGGAPRRHVVVKHLKSDTESSEQRPPRSNRHEIQKFVEEIKILSTLQHRKIVTFLGVAWTMERDVQLMMEYMPHGDLRSYLDYVKCDATDSASSSAFTNPWTWTTAQWRVAIDVIEAMVYLHSLQPALLHCDIKSHNILLGDEFRAKLSDFGISRYVVDDDASFSQRNDQQSTNGDTDSSSYSNWAGLGTGRWIAPEILADDAPYSMASDVYAFGVLLSEIDTCALPFQDRILKHQRQQQSKGEDQDEPIGLSEDIFVHQILRHGWQPAFRAQRCPDRVQELARECLAKDSSARPSSLEVAHRLRKAASESASAADFSSQTSSTR
uniref:Protein kinase domain-containing protein n=1 Tax=Globisporangium ultimum (strain ATCC 200006 / CBS 805.95 / DAOM BR144) TaxID=431595 RepID=K3X9F0_GLOUD